MNTEPKTAGTPTQCAYRGCQENPRVLRATASGILAHYCLVHGRAAQMLFEVKK